MQYKIDPRGIIPTPAQTSLIDERLGLTLSRYNNLVYKCVIKFARIDDDANNVLISCEITASFNATTHFEVSDVGANLTDAFAISLKRIKRNIDRHLSRRKPTRLDNDMSTRAIQG